MANVSLPCAEFRPVVVLDRGVAQQRQAVAPYSVGRPSGKRSRRRHYPAREDLLGKPRHLSREFPIACNRYFGHAAVQERVERIHMERASRSGHFGSASVVLQPHHAAARLML